MTPTSKPATSYDDAFAQVKAMQEEDNLDLARDVCITKLYTHGIQTEHVIVLLHGFTNCPEQFNELGKQYYEAGNNVFIPRMPYHGLTDRMTEALVNLTAGKITSFGERVIDIAHGLGKKVTVMGISGSGTLAAWLAQNRADLGFAFIIAPLFGLAMIPSMFTKLFERIALRLPNFFLWWDPRTKDNNPYSVDYAYPRYPWRALAEIMRLAMITRTQAEKSPPLSKNITMIINDAEPAVSNPEIFRLLKLWKKHGKENLNEYHFEKELKLPHDIITSGTPGLPSEVIQPRLAGVIKNAHLGSAKNNTVVNLDSGIHYSPVDETSAREFLKWKYEPPYENYNYSPEHFERDLAYHIDPINNLYSMYVEDELVGYCSFGRDAQVPGGDYSEDALDIGMMVKPELTGQKLGSKFVKNVVQQAKAKYDPKKLRVTILETNLRAMKVWEKNGFQKKQTFESKHNGTRFVIFTRDA